MAEPELSAEQIDLAFQACRALRWIDTPVRPADVSVVGILGGTVEVLAEYIWDHWMGEPDEPTQQQVADHIRKVLYA